MWSTRGLLNFFKLCSLATLLSGCTGIPADITPVKPFELSRYLGTWYEIARLDHSFERGLSHIKANYALNTDGTVRVINSGLDEKTGEPRQVQGKAKFVRGLDEGYLKVSFYGPFYGSYIIFELDDYQHALVTSYNRDYLWLLARTPAISAEQQEALISKARALGFNTDELIFVDQNSN